MEWKDVTSLITKLAPTIATGLGGPLAGGAVTALEGVFGITTDGSTTDKQNALVGAIGGATADQLLALKKADNDYAIQMAELGFKNKEAIEALATSDRDSARKREEAVKDATPKILAYALVVGFFAVLGVMLFFNVPAASRELLDIMLGMLGTSFTGVTAYYFGSSASDHAKTVMLSKADAIKE